MWLFKLFGQAKNINSDIVVSKVKEDRLNTCKKCTYYRKDFKTLFIKKKGVPQCGVCKCSLHDKAMWETESCPKNYWNV